MSSQVVDVLQASIIQNYLYVEIRGVIDK